MVGAGGIGCEILKNLVLLGVGEIHIVDLDTIDLSNLNRQFLFSHEHIKQPKALVAAQTASKFNPNVKIVPHYSDIKNTTLFPLEWFQSFDLYYNALDNKDARSYVNRMALTANVPLIESGTAGYKGQTLVISNGKTECFECVPKAQPKSFAVCTIRSTPSQPVHTIVWAKNFLFSQLFGPEEESLASTESLDENPDDETDEKEKEEQRQLANELHALRSNLKEEDFARKIFDKIFTEDIANLASMETMWKLRKAPTPLNYEDIVEQITKLDPDTDNSEEAVLRLAKKTAKLEQKDWDMFETFSVFYDSVRRLKERALAENEEGKVTYLSFDKDDEDTLDFVVSAAQLRAYIFHIQTKSKFDYKQIAGNIIPAIATTNAVIAGMSVLQSIKILASLDIKPKSSSSEKEEKVNNTKKTALSDEVLKKCPTVFLAMNPTHIFSTESVSKPNPRCVVCGVSRAVLPVDPAKTKLRDIVETLLDKNWNYSNEVSVLVPTGLIYDPDYDDNLDKTLTELGVTSNSYLTIIDELDEHEDGDSTVGARQNLELFIVTDNKQSEKSSEEILKELEPVEFKTKLPKEEKEEEADTSTTGMKRKLESSPDDPNESSKKLKISENEDGNEVIEFDEDDEEDELIEID